MKKLLILALGILIGLPILVVAQSDAANKTQIDSLLINTARKNNAAFFHRMLANLNASKLNKDSAAFHLTQTGTGFPTYSGGTLNIPKLSLTTTGSGAASLSGNILNIPVSNTTLLTTTINTGAWNMNSTQSITVTHGISDISKIRAVSVIISNDAQTIYYDFFKQGNGGDAVSGNINNGIGATTLTLTCNGTGLFHTNTAFDDGVINRGYVTITYTP